MDTVSFPDRVRAKIDFDAPDGHWLWTGANNYHYGHLRWNGVVTKAHRVVWEILVSPLPDDRSMTLDHLCRVKLCVNPGHLELVTNGENVRRDWPHRNRATHCPKGHEFTPENTFMHTARSGRSGVHRECVECRRDAAREQARLINKAAATLDMRRVDYVRIHGTGNRVARDIIESHQVVAEAK